MCQCGHNEGFTHGRPHSQPVSRSVDKAKLIHHGALARTETLVTHRGTQFQIIQHRDGKLRKPGITGPTLGAWQHLGADELIVENRGSRGPIGLFFFPALIAGRHGYLTAGQFESAQGHVAVQDQVVGLQLGFVVEFVLPEDRFRHVLWRSEARIHRAEGVVATFHIADDIAVEALIDGAETELLGLRAAIILQTEGIVCIAFPTLQKRHCEIDTG